MGSINLSNLLMNMHTNTVTSTNTVSATKSNAEMGGFSTALDKAKQNDTVKVSDKKSSCNGQDKTTTKKTSKSTKQDVANLEEDKATVSNEVAAAILEILSVELQLPTEELTCMLNELGLSPVDLLQENNFSQFLTAFYSESTPEELLMGNAQIKDISKLFTKIEEVSTQIVGEEIQKVVEETAVIDQVVTTQNQTVVMEEITTQVIEEGVNSEEVVSSLWQTKEDKSSSQEPITPSTQNINTLPIDQLGLTVPIEAFESTISLTNDQVQTNQTTGGVHVNPDLNLASQIVDHIEVTKLEQMQEIKMQLSPKELGQLTIKLVEKNGMLVAEIKVESEKTKDFILNEINTLKDSLTEQGINISDVQVDVKQHNNASQMEQQRQKSSKRIQEIISKHVQELEAEEAEINKEETLNIGENEIDYMI